MLGFVGAMIKGYSSGPTSASSAHIGPHRNFLENALKGEGVPGT